MMTYSAPASRTIAALTSPVNAPSFSQNTSCAATATGEFLDASATACTARNGGATTISTPVTSLTIVRNSLVYTTASCTVLNIFQLPAMRGVRMGGLYLGFRPQTTGCRRRRASAGGPEPAVCSLLPAVWQPVYLSVSAATPGSTRPPRNSSEAPPPVEMCEMRSVTPALWTAEIESPPPMMVVPVTFATAS